MPNKLKPDNLILPVFMLLLLSGCTTIYNPATQKKETLLFDTADEVALGKQMDKEAQNKLKLETNPQALYRLSYIGDKVASASDRQDLVYNFRVVRDKELNAFTIPGGFVYVNSGLMNITTDDELACVLAHEIGHVAARHSVKKLQAALGYQILMNIALGISGKQSAAEALDITFNLTSLSYSRKDELLADKLALKYAKSAGFNPRGMITFLAKLKEEAQKQGRNSNIVFLSSHPAIDERIKKAENEITLNP